MKVFLEIDEDQEEVIIIKAKQASDEIKQLMHQIEDLTKGVRTLLVYDSRKEIIIDINDIYFFETENDQVFVHTKDNAYLCKLRLYELLEKLPNNFSRISKSTIININYVYSLEKKFTSSTLVNFINTHKQVYISRHYYQSIKEKLNERSLI